MTESVYTAAYDKLVQAIVEARKKAGLTQRQLAEKLGREQNYVGRIETHQRRVDMVELVWWLRACGADPQKEIGAIVKTIADSVQGRKRRHRRS